MPWPGPAPGDPADGQLGYPPGSAPGRTSTEPGDGRHGRRDVLLIQPVAAVLLSAAVLGERPSAWQLAGCAVVIAAVVWGSLGPSQDEWKAA